MLRKRTNTLLSLTALLLWTGARAGPEHPAHDLHVSYGRMAIEDNHVVCQIRFFRHDLEEALQIYLKDPDFRMAVDPHTEALYLRYLDERFRLETAGERLHAVVTSSGEEGDMWWYTMLYEAREPIQKLTVVNELLFDRFEDQKNILAVKRFPGNEVRTLYFARGVEEQTVSF